MVGSSCPWQRCPAVAVLLVPCLVHQVASAAASSSAVSADTLAVNASPIIGILTVPLADDGSCVTVDERGRHVRVPAPGTPAGRGGSCFDSLYPQWIAAAGGRVVPIRFDMPALEMEELFHSLNGVLFTGGETDIRLLNSTYMQAAGRLFSLAKAVHMSGQHVPLWGTCMGFQTLAVLAAGDARALTSRGIPAGNPGFDSESLSLPLDWAPNASTATNIGRGLATVAGVRLSPSSVANPVYDWLGSDNITTNLHHDGVSPLAFTQFPTLKAFFNIVSTNLDRKGKEFVSTIEAADGSPVYGVQWHPERNQFQFSASADEDGIDHSLHAIRSMQAMANFFVVHEARQNTQHFASEQAREAALLYNWSPVGPKGDSYRAYMFPSWQPPGDSVVEGFTQPSKK